jgi:hypothetical protein
LMVRLKHGVEIFMNLVGISMEFETFFEDKS